MTWMPQIHPHHFLDEGNQQHQAWPLDPLKTPQGKHHRAFIFAQDPDGRADQDKGHDQYGRNDR